MTLKICFIHIFFSQNRNSIILCNDLFSIWIVHPVLLVPAVTSVSDRKMWSHLLCDQNGHLIRDLILVDHHICRRIRSNRKLSKWKCLMIVQNIFPDIGFILLFFLKVCTSIICDHSILKFDLQIFILHSMQIYFTDKQCSVCSFQCRRGEHFPCRNIDIRTTVFKDCLLLRII